MDKELDLFNESNIDPETGLEHISPLGMEHHNKRTSNKGEWYASLKLKHFLICEHQKLFPELAEKMKANPNNATNIYTAFLVMLPLKLKGRLTPDLKRIILKTYKII